ncbi:hypothetical protein HDU76_013818 [Blyttiomyces sp. JEL0837]|nr:hypothetical protein HDU76_013818 [Blyttiomyces sp. JEL0837]
MKEIASCIKSYSKTFAENPIFGVQFETEEELAAKVHKVLETKVPKSKDENSDIEITPDDEFDSSLAMSEKKLAAIAIYKMEEEIKDEDLEFICDPDLGLCCEKIPGDKTIPQLWRIR